MKERSLKDLFHRVKQVLPEEQELITTPPDSPVQDALAIMREHNISQIPIVEGTEVLGVFSYRSFAQGILRLGDKEQEPAALPVELFSEDLRFAHITDEVSALLDEFDFKDAVLVGAEDHLQGIVTSMDALLYFYRVSNAYILLREIELATRELMRASLNEQELNECVDRCLNHYEKNKAPSRLEEMTFNDYISILKFKKFWNNFKNTFGGSYRVVQSKLDMLPDLRNAVFHFRRELTVEEYDTLRDSRDWLLKRIRKLEASRRKQHA